MGVEILRAARNAALRMTLVRASGATLAENALVKAGGRAGEGEVDAEVEILRAAKNAALRMTLVRDTCARTWCCFAGECGSPAPGFDTAPGLRL